MSIATPFALGLGGGLALWQLTRPSKPSSASDNIDRSRCLIQLDGTGITIDNARVDVAEAARRAQKLGRAVITVTTDAPASTFAELMAALRTANVATEVRAAKVLARNAAPKTNPLPVPKRPRDARATQRYTLEGRTILRDGQAILFMDRVDLGDARYALSPYHADLLAQRIVRLLNKHGGR